MNNSIIKVQGLSHRYRKDWAIREISFEIDKPGVMGLLGSNGAGKSTTMNIMCGVLNQTEGNVFIGDIDLRKFPLEAKKKIGFLPQTAPLYLDLTVDEYLIHCAHLRHIPTGKIAAALFEAKEKCGIMHFSKRLLKNLSGGYRQRVGIAQAIIHRPAIVVLDEPTNGLDPNQILEVRSLIKEIGKDRSVILSSHILSEIQATCQEIKMIEHGKLVFSDTMDAFNNYLQPDTILLKMRNPPSAETLLNIDGITRADVLETAEIRLQYQGSAEITERIIQLSVANGWQLLEIMVEKGSADAVFAQLSKINKNYNENYI